ncbi:T9SS type A sorting domain-containing protein [Flavobacterium wongokense]|uniref:T9SS type A sorting domain-containing protein n=1 Tax=Flavobacterium wongokense TaxID=2910674 RepID=UPI001F2CF74E|nr:T9SS type A sorting domain-containing protein [Flavobacterium sp. WG47]MCF6131202.1 T9SS type A sorting domain-containing protein [Flavobacterium sp. WG47]
MKKNYTDALLIFVFGLFLSFNCNAQLVAGSDFASVQHSNNVQIPIQNVLGNDTLGGIPVTLSQVTVTQISATTNLSLQANGSVVLAAGATTGTYGIYYNLCEIANPTNCVEGYVTVYVTPAPIVPTPDTVTISTGLLSPQIILENALANDTLGGIPVSISDVTINQASSTASAYFSINTTTGNIMQISNPPPGTYTLNYSYCENSNPNNCTTTSATITVVNSLSTGITATYQDLNGDGVTNVGDVINYTYSITNHAASAVTNISITSADVNINGGPPIASLNSNATNSSTYTGVHPITQQDINNGSVVVAIQTNGTLSGNPISITTTNTRNLNISNGIKLNAFLDYNSNGTQETGEPNVNYGSFQYQLNDNGTTHDITSSTGTHYMYETNPANSYDFGYTISPQYAAQYVLTPMTYSNVTVPNGSGVLTYNFALSAANPYKDLGVYIYAPASPRPGFTYQNVIYYQNYGNQTIASGTVTFVNDDNVSISTYPAGSTPTANGFTYNFTNLLPGQSGSITVGMLVPVIPTVSLGDLVTNTASVTIPTNDVNVNNNTAIYTRVIVGSYDPNDKAESHGPQVLHSAFTANDFLTYTIRFENTGTAEAINVRVNDILNAKLDETTVRMVASSHPYVLDRVGSNLTWRFDGINLEPSIPNNSVIGHGYIVFQVKPKAGYAIGDVITNTASIFFDFNPAIVTNTWSTTFVPVLGVKNFAFNNFVYYPNPVNTVLNISNASTIDRLEITSVLGQRIKSMMVNDLHAELDLSDLRRGVYFVKVSSEGQEKTVKIIKD